MTSAQKSETSPDTDAGNDKSGNEKTKETKEKDSVKKTKEKTKAADGNAKAKDAEKKDTKEEPKKAIRKTRATAREIDKTQAKRLVRRTTPGLKMKRKIVRAVKTVKPARDIGVDVAPPEESCNDPYCPFHGTLPVRGQILNGIVVTAKMDKTAIIQREVLRVIPKYERFEKRTYSYAVHNPPCINVQRGDLVKIMECRPLSKSKSFVVIEKT